jgi:hypothetical protein
MSRIRRAKVRIRGLKEAPKTKARDHPLLHGPGGEDLLIELHEIGLISCSYKMTDASTIVCVIASEDLRM